MVSKPLTTTSPPDAEADCMAHFEDATHVPEDLDKGEVRAEVNMGPAKNQRALSQGERRRSPFRTALESRHI